MKKKLGFISRLFSPTPQEWKRRAKTFGMLALTFTTAFGAVKGLSIATPEYFDMYVGAVIFICTAIATYCQQHEIK
jgi:hypothetical protein